MFVRWSRDGRWLYFSSGRGSRFHLVREPAGGGRPEQVTPDGALAVLGVLSSFVLTPDDRSVIYPSGETQEALWLRRDDGTQAQLTLEGNARDPTPFGDGGRILYIFGPRFSPGQVWLRTLDGTHAHRLFPGFEAESAAPSHDGRHVVFSSDRKRLWIGTVDNSVAPRELTGAEGLSDVEQLLPQFSPDDTAVFYAERRRRSGEVRIVRVNVDGTGHRPLTDSEPGLQLRSVSPDGKWISVMRDGRTPREAWIFPADVPGNGRKLWNTWSFAWMPGGRGFLVAAGGMVSSAWVLPNRFGAILPPDLGSDPTEATFAGVGGRNVLTDYFFIRPTPMVAPVTIAYSKVVNHSNLYQLRLR